MSLSKVKSTKAKKRLEARQAAYANLSPELKRENQGSFTKPGSNRK